MTATARTLFLVAATFGLAGCYTFQPVSYDQISPGATVRARVTGEWSDSVAEVLRSDSRVVEGTVVDKPGGERVMMEVTVQNELRGIEFQSLRQRVSLPRSAFVELELKELDRGRTVGVAALAAGAVAVFVIQQLSKDSGGGALPGGGGPTESRVWNPPIFRIPLP